MIPSQYQNTPMAQYFNPYDPSNPGQTYSWDSGSKQWIPNSNGGTSGGATSEGSAASSGVGGQIAGTAGSIGGAYAGHKVIDALSSTPATTSVANSGTGGIAELGAESVVPDASTFGSSVPSTFSMPSTSAYSLGADTATPVAETATEATTTAAPNATSSGTGMSSGTAGGVIAAAIAAQKGYEHTNRTSKQKNGDTLSENQATNAMDPYQNLFKAKTNPLTWLKQHDQVTNRLESRVPDSLKKYLPATMLSRGLTDDKTLAEQRRLKALAAAGYANLPDAESYSKSGKRARNAADALELAADTAKYGADYMGNGEGGRFVNTAFGNTRDEKKLTPIDIQGFAAMYEAGGPNATAADRLALAQDALAADAVREHHGTIDVDWDKVDLYKKALEPEVKTPIPVDPNAPKEVQFA